MSNNPYASPTAESVNIQVNQFDSTSLPIASQGKRFLNLIIDSIVTQILSGIAGFIVGIIYGATQIATNGSVTAQDESMLRLIGSVLGLVVWLAYYVFMETIFQRTIGKLITGTMVVRETGERPSLGQILGRSFARFIPFEPFSFLGSKFPAGWHDSLSRTRVINIR